VFPGGREGKRYINVRYTVHIIVLKYFWSPLDINIEYDETMLNELARVDTYSFLNCYNSTRLYIETYVQLKTLPQQLQLIAKLRLSYSLKDPELGNFVIRL
jgi:hypothetical protein